MSRRPEHWITLGIVLRAELGDLGLRVLGLGVLGFGVWGGLRIELGDGSFRLKKSFEAGNKVARTIVIVGEDEVASGILTVKHFASGEQFKVPRGQLGQKLTALLAPTPTATSN